MIPKRCKICRGHVIGNNSFICVDCENFREYKNKHRDIKSKVDDSEYRFQFEPRLVYNMNKERGEVYGYHDNIHDRIVINLHAIKGRLNLPKVCADIIIHESEHQCLFRLESREVSASYDKIAQKIEAWLGISFRSEDE